MAGEFDRALTGAFGPGQLMGWFDPWSGIAPFATGAARTSAGTQRAMPLDIIETKEAIEVHADVPGVDRKDIHVEADRNILTLSVDSSSKKDDQGGSEEEGTKWHRYERSHFFVKRTVRLPDDVDATQATAEYVDGVLKLRLPRVEQKATTKRIEIS